jgi:uncharacterized NAD(P)/FAD-binding protein YdhS
MSAAGTLQFDACRIGLKVDADGRAIGLDGQPSKSLRVVGPPTLGAFGDPIGAFFIAAQIHRFVPAALNDLLESAAAA